VSSARACSGAVRAASEQEAVDARAGVAHYRNPHPRRQGDRVERPAVIRSASGGRDEGFEFLPLRAHKLRGYGNARSVRRIAAADGAPGATTQNAVTALRKARSKSPIQHIVLVVQESRTFNDLFTTTKFGEMRVGHKTIRVKLKEVDLNAKGPERDDYFAYLKSYRHGHMDGFNLAAYECVNPSDIQSYFTLASEYRLADRMFQTQGSGDFTDHPGYNSDTGPAWVASVVNAIGESSYWELNGDPDRVGRLGRFLMVPLRRRNSTIKEAPGFRVPMIVVSPYVPQGEVSHTVYGFGSIARFIEDTWNLGRLGTTDKTSKSVGNMLNFDQLPRPFSPAAGWVAWRRLRRW
jgi:Phosphoesterase family